MSNDTPTETLLRIDPSLITVKDSPYVYSIGAVPMDLVDSIRELGLLSPPLVVPATEGLPWLCVTGSRRIQAWQQARVEPIPSRTLPTGYPPRQLMAIAIDDNCCHRQLNPVECGRICSRLLGALGIDRAVVVYEFLPRMGQAAGEAALNRLLQLPQLPPLIQDMVATGTFPPGHVNLFLRFPPRERPVVAEAIAGLHFSSSRLRQFMGMCRDVAVRQDVPAEEILHRIGALPPPAPGAPNLPQLTEAIFNALYCLARPFLSRKEETFACLQAAICAHTPARLNPYPFFEKREFKLDFSFHSPAEYTDTLAKLAEPTRQSAVAKLFETQGLAEDIAGRKDAEITKK